MRRSKSILFILVILIQCLLWGWVGYLDEGLNHDEMLIYHYASSMFADAGNRTDFIGQSDFYNRNHTNKDFFDTLSVQEGDGLLDQSFQGICNALLKEDTYTVFLNFVMSIGGGQFNKWYCIGLNMILFVLCQLVLISICRNIGMNWHYAFLVLCSYGFSIAAGKPITFLRFYEFYILMTLLYLNNGLVMLKQEKVNTKYVLCTILSLILTYYGYINAEYMLIFAGIFSIVFIVMSLLKREWKKTIVYVAFYAMGGVAFVFKYGRAIVSAINDVNSQYGAAINKIMQFDLQGFVKYFMLYSKELLIDSASIIWIVAIVILTIFLFVSRRRVVLSLGSSWWVILCTSIGYVIGVAAVAPWIAWRYCTNVAPLLSVVLIWVLCELLKGLDEEKRVSILLVFAQVFYLVMTFESSGVSGGEVKYEIHNMISEEYGNLDGIMFATEDTGDLYYGAFMWPENGRMYVTSTEMIAEDTEDKKTILENDELLVWARSEEKWEAEIEPIMNSLGYLDNEMVIDTGEARFLIYLCKR